MKRYHPILVTLHWLLAALIIGGLIMGGQVLAKTANADPAKLLSLKLHMSLGLIILILMLIRLVMRFMTSKPAPIDTGNALVNLAGKGAHWALYILVIALAGSGLAIANLAGLPDIVFFGADTALPANFDDIAPRAAHGILSKLLALTILAHIAGFLYHQFLRKDGLFSRMWYGNRR